MVCGEEKENAFSRKLVMLTYEKKLQVPMSKDLCGGSGAYQRAPRTKRQEDGRSLSPMAIGKRMSWQRQVRCWMRASWRKREQRLSMREQVCAALQHAAGFHCLVEEWKDCEELKPKPKEK